MTSDVRALLRAAAETGAADFGASLAMRRGRWLRWRRRIQVAIPAAIALAVLIALLLVPGLRIVGEARDIAPLDRPGRTQVAGKDSPSPSTTATQRRPGAAVEAPSDEANSPMPVAQAQVEGSDACNPLIVDLGGDVRDGSIDILRSSVSYRATTETVTFTHVLRDIELEDGPGEGPSYDMRFVWDGVEYSAEAWVDVSGRQQFVVHAGGRGTLAPVEYGNVHGRIDPVSDTVTLRFTLDEFDESAKRSADNASRPAPRELKAGSTLSEMRLVANPRGSSTSMTEQHETDVGSARCDYVVGR